MAKLRGTTMTVEYTISRAGTEKGDAAFSEILKAVQRVLGEKYAVQRLIVHQEEPNWSNSDKVFETGWRRGYWEYHIEYTGEDLEGPTDEELAEIEAETVRDSLLGEQVEAENVEALEEEAALDRIEAEEEMMQQTTPEGPTPAA